MTLITVTKTAYGYKVGTSQKTLPTDRQVKLANAYLKKHQEQPCNLKVA